jgi:RNA polymerase sigma-70 factor (ECF subfamily)
VVLINRAIAVAQVEGPAAGLCALKAVPVDSQMERYPFLHAAEGAFHCRLGHGSEAQISFQRALEFARTEPQRRFLLRKLAAMSSTGA